MPLVCLWSGLMLGNMKKHEGIKSAPKITRYTNAAVESWMNIVKTYTLGKQRPVRIGMFVKEEFKVVKGRLREYLSNVSAIKTQRNHSKINNWIKKQLNTQRSLGKDHPNIKGRSRTSFLQSKNVLNQSYKDCKNNYA